MAWREHRPPRFLQGIVNLPPANLRKEGAAFDLPIALAILAALKGVVSVKSLEGRGCGRGTLARRRLARSQGRSRWLKARGARVFGNWGLVDEFSEVRD